MSSESLRILSVIYPMPFTRLYDDALLIRITKLKSLLESHGHNVDLVCYAPDYLYQEAPSSDIFGHINFHISKIPILNHLNDLRRNKYDVVFCNHSWSCFNSSLLKPLNANILLDLHGLSDEEYLLKTGQSPILSPIAHILKMTSKISYYSSKKILCVSKRMQKYLESKYSIPHEKIAQIPNGVDLNLFSPKDIESSMSLRRKYNLQDRTVFGYIGGLQKWQGVDLLISVAKSINDKNIHFIVVGGDKFEQIGNITFIPRASRLDIPNYCSMCDVLVLPRPKGVVTDVASPTKFAEYAAMGKPILTTGVGDAAELVKKYDCGLVSDGDITSFSNAIKYFHEANKESIERMGNNARRMAEVEFDWNSIGDRLSNVVCNL